MNRLAEPSSLSSDASDSERAERDTQGTEISNTVPSISEDSFSGGIDTLAVSCFGFVAEADNVSEWLREGQETARELADSDDHIERVGSVDLIHHVSGGNAAGQNCKYSVTYRGVRFMISQRWDSQNASFPTFQANFGSMVLMIEGYQGCLDILNEFSDLIGFTMTSNRVNRVDLCVDLSNVDMSEFQKCYFEDRIVAAGQSHEFGI